MSTAESHFFITLTEPIIKEFDVLLKFFDMSIKIVDL